MEATPLSVERLSRVLDKIVDRSAGETFEIRRDFPDGNITGYIVRRAFDGIRTAERQADLWNYLREELGPDSVDVGLILAFSPEEFSDWLEDAKSG